MLKYDLNNIGKIDSNYTKTIIFKTQNLQTGRIVEKTIVASGRLGICSKVKETIKSYEH